MVFDVTKHRSDKASLKLQPKNEWVDKMLYPKGDCSKVWLVSVKVVRFHTWLPTTASNF